MKFPHYQIEDHTHKPSRGPKTITSFMSAFGKEMRTMHRGNFRVLAFRRCYLYVYVLYFMFLSLNVSLSMPSAD